MKIYSKIIGVLLTAFGLGFLLIFIVQFIEHYDEFDASAYAILVIILIFLHFLYIHNFGFNLKLEVSKKINLLARILMISTTLLTMGLIGYIVIQWNIKLKEDKAKNEKIEKANKAIDLNGDARKAGVKKNLKIKYDNKLYYIFEVYNEDKTQFDQSIKEFHIELQDKDGFILEVIIVSNLVNMVDVNDVRYGYIANSSHEMDLDKYLLVTDWQLTYFNE